MDEQVRLFDDGEEAGGWAHESCADTVERDDSLSIGRRVSNRLPAKRQGLTCVYCDLPYAGGSKAQGEA